MLGAAASTAAQDTPEHRRKRAASLDLSMLAGCLEIEPAR